MVVSYEKAYKLQLKNLFVISPWLMRCFPYSSLSLPPHPFYYDGLGSV